MGAGTKSQEQLSSLKRNIGREIGRAELFLLESLGERENEGRRRRRRRTKGDAKEKTRVVAADKRMTEYRFGLTDVLSSMHTMLTISRKFPPPFIPQIFLVLLTI